MTTPADTQDKKSGDGASGVKDLQAEINEAAVELAKANVQKPTPSPVSQAKLPQAQAASEKPKIVSPSLPIAPATLPSKDAGVGSVGGGIPEGNEPKIGADKPAVEKPVVPVVKGSPHTSKEKPGLPHFRQTSGNLPLGFAGAPKPAGVGKKEEKKLPEVKLPAAPMPALQGSKQIPKALGVPGRSKKSGGGGKKVVLAIVGFLFLVGAVAGAVLLYTSRETARIAEISGGTCKGSYTCTRDSDGKEFNYVCSRFDTQEQCEADGAGGFGAYCDSGYTLSGSCTWNEGGGNGEEGDWTEYCHPTRGAANCQDGKKQGYSCQEDRVCGFVEKDGTYSWAGGEVGGGIYLKPGDYYKCSCDAAGGSEANCGEEPDFNEYNVSPTIMSFSEAGTVVLYYKSLLGNDYRPIFNFEHDGNAYAISALNLDGNDRARIVTDIQVGAGDSITLTNVEESELGTLDVCAPDKDKLPPYFAFGWIGVGTDETNKCGTILPGPPTQYTPFEPVDVSRDITWADLRGEDVVSRMCWADNREWPGDYDFNDFFLQVAVEPSESGEPRLYCSNKQAYRDEPNNTAGSYYLEEKIGSSSTVEPDEVIVYTVDYRNTGTVDVDSAMITDALPSGVEFLDANNGCRYAASSHTVSCVIGLVAAGARSSTAYRVAVVSDASGTLANTAELEPSEGDKSSCSLDVSVASPTVACNSITDIESPEIGDTVEFVCDGSASGGETLVYNFRYSLDNADFLDNSGFDSISGDTAALTITEAGFYLVECQICLQGGDTCSPNWGSVSVE